MATIAERLRDALDRKNMKQAELSEITGIGKSSISTYLSGEYEPKQKNIYKMAKALDVNEAWLMGEDVPPDRKQRIIQSEEIADLSEESLLVVKAYNTASPAVKFSVRKLLDIPEPVIQFGLAARDGEGDVITATKETVDAAAKERQRLLEDDDQPDL